MFVEEYSRYTLLTRRTSFSSPPTWDKRTVILICALTFPVFIFCATYMILFGVYEKIVYPTVPIDKVPQLSLHRAELYNMFPDKVNASYDLHYKVGRSNDIPNFKLVCYYNFPSNAQSLQVTDLDPSLCTHINVAFAQVVNNSMYLDPSNEDTLADLVKLKETNADLKILLSVGGAGGDAGFPEMVLNHANRKSFIKSVVNYVKTYGIDGVDLDWEFPNEHPGNDKYQRMHFTQLLEEFRHTIDRQTKHPFLLSIAVAAPTNIIDGSYDVPYINQFVDYVNVMTYDLHYYTKFTPFTGINSPLYASNNDMYYLATLNINYTANYWNYLGMNRDKIILGLPTYGHTFRLANMRNNGLYAPSFGYGRLGTLGFADYPQICTFLSSNHISSVFDMETKSPYAAKFLEWISFDNPESLTYKAEYIRDHQFGGAMVYSLNSDDYKGVCKMPDGSTERFPLTKVVKKVLDKGEM